VNRIKIAGFMLLSFIFISFSAIARSIPPIVSVEWLSQNLNAPNLVIVDIRSFELFKMSHIPGAIHIPFSDWVRQDEQRMLELPETQTLRELLGILGITADSTIVVVNKTDTDWNRADATRVAWSCIVSGIQNVSVLDGGYNRWLNRKLPVTVDIVPSVTIHYDGVIDPTVTIKTTVMDTIGKSAIIDARLPEDYFGLTKEKGHIKSALNLPAPWAYNTDGTFRDEADLKAMASGLISRDLQNEIIVYCEVGGFASTWWFILSEVLGYKNVKLYDGSFQEWSQDPDAPTTKFRWD